MNFDNCLIWLDKLHRLNQQSSLSRFSEKLLQLDCYPSLPKIVTVAGTNGKGTTCVALESILLAAGYKTGCYLSPHLINITERFRINGETISEAEFCAAFAIAQSVCSIDDMQWFEFLTLVAMIIFANYPLDFLILEVGLGGKKDVVNAIDPDVAIITSVALDHTDVLGNTQELIGAQKAGIFRAHKPAIYAEENPPWSVIKHAEEIAANLILYGRDYSYEEKGEEKGEAGWIWRNKNLESPLLPYPKFPMANAAAAIASLFSLVEIRDISWETIAAGLTHAFLPGRFQILQHEPLVICDVAHNPHAATYLAEQLAQQACSGNTYAVVGMQTKKDIANTLAPMLKIVDQWYISSISETQHASVTFVTIAKEFLQDVVVVTVTESISAGLALALKTAKPNDRIIIFGSFLTIQQAIEEVKCLAQ